MRTLLIAEHLFTPDEAPPGSTVVIEDGFVAEIVSRQDVEARPADQLVEFPGCTLLPAFFDIHIHGAEGHDVMEGTAASFNAISKFLASRGVAAFLATTVTASMDATLAALSGMASLMSKDFPGARPAGIHLEGPFLSHAKRGVHPPHELQPPSIENFDRMWQAAEGHVKLITIAPELPNAEDLIAHATGLGVRVSLGHSDATAAEARRGIAAGARSATHTFNAMRALHHREPGIAGVVLDDDSFYAEIICDGVHVAPEMVRLYWKAKGAGRAILVTDAMGATGMPDGVYKLGGLEVQVAGGICTLDGVLAGSTLTMDRAVKNFCSFTSIGMGTAAALAGRNPARMTGLDSSIGSLSVGRGADVVILSPEGDVVATLLRGRIAFRR